MRKHTLFFIIQAGLLLLVTGCGNRNNNPHPDVSDVHVDQPVIIRLEQMLATATPENYKEVFAGIERQYPEIFESYYRNFWGLVGTDSLHPVNVYDSLFFNVAGNEWMHRLNDSVQLIYKNMSDVEKEIKTAFTYYKYYFPDSTLPQLFTYLGPFVYQTLFDNNTLGIELDMYMGKHFGYYGSYENNIPEYVAQRLDKPFIVVNVMQSLMDGNIVSLGPEATLLDEIIAAGKMLYYLDCMLPDVEDSLKMGYTGKQIEWCQDNEGEIWKFLAGEELLFSKKTDDMRRYLGEAPTSVGMPDEAPGRVAVWMGWQIVRSYMHENKDVTLLQLFADPDALGILKESGFEPEN